MQVASVDLPIAVWRCAGPACAPPPGQCLFCTEGSSESTVVEELLQDQSGKPTGAAKAEIAVCLKTCIVCAVCMGAGTWAYLCGNKSVQSKRCGCVSKVLCVHEVKLL